MQDKELTENVIDLVVYGVVFPKVFAISVTPRCSLVTSRLKNTIHAQLHFLDLRKTDISLDDVAV